MAGVDIDKIIEKPINKNRDIEKEVEELYGGPGSTSTHFKAHLHNEMGVGQDGRVTGENRKAGFGMGGF